MGNFSNSRLGVSFVTRRWFLVIAEAIPTGLAGDPILVDETIQRFNPEIPALGDIVSTSIASGDRLQGHRVLQQKKRRAATVIVGGIHGTFFPDEPLDKGTDGVLSGNGDLDWPRAIQAQNTAQGRPRV